MAHPGHGGCHERRRRFSSDANSLIGGMTLGFAGYIASWLCGSEAALDGNGFERHERTRLTPLTTTARI